MMSLGAEAARQEIERSDESHRAFTSHYFGAGRDDPVHYDYTVDTGRVTDEQTAGTIIEATAIRRAAQAAG